MAHYLSSAVNSSISPFTGRSVQPTLWRGTLTVTGIRASDRNSSQNLHVTAVETDGESRIDLWPHQLFVYAKYNSPVLREFIAWVNQNNPPTCTVMPTQFSDADENAINQSTFRSLSRVLYETQTIAVAAWDVDSVPGTGIVFYPAQNSSAMLVGVFLQGPFPDFILGVSTPLQLPQTRQLSYNHGTGAGSYDTAYSRPTSSPASSGSHSPVDSYPYMAISGYAAQNQSAGYDATYPYTRAQNQQRYV
ncbi:hypothetical protein M378DRAFT_26607 [Amanita muscaria Koide BX008]|uniref:Uncharacterized protein n=1 Tax=Amanita muscaria (strain Koide BX008) TaxID=946122 RepID=A0A0C2SBR1_AMAMK|nr:hypothetical protein M378DRAFT_26607 [Amanita muscaria Koide BX008]